MKVIKKIGCLIVIGAMVLSMVGCTKKQETADGKASVKVVTTMFAAYDFAKQAGSEQVEVTMLLKPGSESHTYEPTPKDIKEIENCDVFIYTGGENDTWVKQILESIDNSEMKQIKLLDTVEVLEEELVEGMEEEEEAAKEGEEGPEWDEHVWMSPSNAKKIVEKISQVYAEVDKEHEEQYKQNKESFALKMDKLDEELRTVIDKGVRKEIIFADRFPARYFTEEYGLKYYAAFPGCSENTEASAATVSFLIDKVREDKVPVVFKIELSNGKLAGTVSEETQAEILTFYTGHNVTAEDLKAGVTYEELMRRNLEALKKALY